MTPDELRRAIIHELDGMVSEFIHPNEFGVDDVDYGQLADVVMPVLAEALAERDAKITELRSLLRARDENLHTEAEGWKDMVSALSAQEARAKAERDLALWLHAEAVWRDQARHGLLDDLVREQTARCDAQGDFREALRQRDQARAERDRLSTLRAVVLPEDWNRRVRHAFADEALAGVAKLIESWRPSTGDTDGTAEQWRLDEREIDGGFAGTEYPRLWPPHQAALPEGHTEQMACREWEGLDLEVEDNSACVKCGRLYERHAEQPGDQT